MRSQDTPGAWGRDRRGQEASEEKAASVSVCPSFHLYCWIRFPSLLLSVRLPQALLLSHSPCTWPALMGTLSSGRSSRLLGGRGTRMISLGWCPPVATHWAAVVESRELTDMATWRG